MSQVLSNGNMANSERIGRRRAALIAYDVCRRALAPSDPARRAAMRPVLGLDEVVAMAIALAAGGGATPPSPPRIAGPRGHSNAPARTRRPGCACPILRATRR